MAKYNGGKQIYLTCITKSLEVRLINARVRAHRRPRITAGSLSLPAIMRLPRAPRTAISSRHMVSSCTASNTTRPSRFRWPHLYKHGKRQVLQFGIRNEFDSRISRLCNVEILSAHSSLPVIMFAFRLY